MKTIALRLDPETRRKLDILAEATGYRPATLVAVAVERFVDAELAAMAAMQQDAANASQNTSEEERPATPDRWNLIV